MAEIGPIALTIASGRRGHGFTVQDESGAPIVTMIYSDHDDAEVAHCWARAMMVNVVAIAAAKDVLVARAA